MIGEYCSRLCVLEGFFAHAEQANTNTPVRRPQSVVWGGGGTEKQLVRVSGAPQTKSKSPSQVEPQLDREPATLRVTTSPSSKKSPAPFRRCLDLTSWLSQKAGQVNLGSVATKKLSQNRGSLHLRIPDVSGTASLGRSAGFCCRRLRIPSRPSRNTPAIHTPATPAILLDFV
jgi:hypothetical protein